MIIKCPECGHDVSDQAENCPQCGYRIKPKKKIRWGLVAAITALVLVCLIAGAGYVKYQLDQKEKEHRIYSQAMQSNDWEVLQNYLDMYEDKAPQEHIDSIRYRMNEVSQSEDDWEKILKNGTRALLNKFLQKHPDSEHAREAEHLLDSLDWMTVIANKTLDGLQKYVTEHINGDHVDEANQLMNDIRNGEVTDDDVEFVKRIFQEYFNSLSIKDERGLLGTVSTILSNFLGKTNASKNDVLEFMKRVYNGDVLTSEWTLMDDFKVTKKTAEDGLGGTDYTVSFSVEEKVQNMEGNNNKLNTYHITAKVDKYGKISAFVMDKAVADRPPVQPGQSRNNPLPDPGQSQKQGQSYHDPAVNPDPTR